ncbi:uncharacterized protein LOC135484341 [Lineus longissimus]|uniref:uncharacterized protein LOC135484341 n=1 Tax=Lineus longissimus TaxID=88925 RepID=UPI002B4E3AC3
MADGASSTDMLIIQTGGTIDKDYPKVTGGYAFEIGDSAAMRILTRMQPSFNMSFISACRKDSQKITDDDRTHLSEAVRGYSGSKVLIAHGTDTLIETATYLANNTSGLEKVVILTGAMKPETFKMSDADFNIGVAVGALQGLQQHGVYVAMNGCVYKWDQVRRNMETGQFCAK